ncbi:hypothetical protein [uncultured Friedmanniella sp.]|uniref:hypothetical protein n=1 Tax=uncultured Friedmanniella sp. TaxID=335381 RepID=UPI0035CBA11C
MTITFVRLLTGRVMPVDPVPDERGNVLAERARDGHLIRGLVRPVDQGDPAPPLKRYMPHFATCSNPPKSATPVASTTDAAPAAVAPEPLF